MSDERNQDDVTPAGHASPPVAQPDPRAPAASAQPLYDVAGAALGALARDEDAQLYAAAAADPVVSAELADMEAVAAELARLAPPQPMSRGRSAGIRSRLVARAGGTHTGRPLSRASGPELDQPATTTPHRPPTRPASAPASRAPAHTAVGVQKPRHVTGSHVIPFEPRQRPAWGRIAAVVAVAAAIVIAAFGVYNWRRVSTIGSAETAAASQDSSLQRQIAALQASVARKDSLIAALTGMHTRVIDLTAYNSADPMGRVFWDQKKQMFIMYASNLRQPPLGKRYQMWLMPRGATAPVSAGSFMPDASGSVIMMTKHPMEPGTLRRIAVTAEPDSGVTRPTGPVMFVGIGR